jgi:hypothetical protein
MDDFFTDNRQRRETAVQLNRSIRTKVERLKDEIKLGLRQITSDKLTEIKNSVLKIKSLGIRI